MPIRHTRETAHRLWAGLMSMILLGTAPAVRDPGHGRRSIRDDRGDVPGWVMITMMTAIVVIVLLGVFQEAVVNAVKNAFDSVAGAGS